MVSSVNETFVIKRSDRKVAQRIPFFVVCLFFFFYFLIAGLAIVLNRTIFSALDILNVVIYVFTVFFPFGHQNPYR